MGAEHAQLVEHYDEEPFQKVSEATVENVASPRFLSTLATDRRVRSVPGLLVEVVLVYCRVSLVHQCQLFEY
jgi:hypothetical protein